MKEIPLTQGKVALVDDEDFDYLSQFKWCVYNHGNTCYAYRTDYNAGNPVCIRMHRIVTSAPEGMLVDHINHDGLDNRRHNLRVCSHSQNSQNRRTEANKVSQYKGVSWHKKNKMWRASITAKGKASYLGYFPTEEDAAQAYNQAAQEHFGEFAHLNEIDHDANQTVHLP